MSAPARNPIEEAVKKLSPAPETSFGDGLNAGRRSDWCAPSVIVLISAPSAPRVMMRFLVRALSISRSLTD